MILFRKDREQQTLDLFRKGDKCAMDMLYQEYADHLAGVCARYISDEDQLKDVLQESFIRIFTQIHLFEYRGKGSLKAWLTRIVINEALMELRKDRTFLVPLQETAVAGIPDEDPDTEGFDAQTLVSFVRQLPPGYRAVFNLFVVEEKTHKEIADILHIQPATSASQLSRAKQMLTKMIKAHHHKTGKR